MPAVPLSAPTPAAKGKAGAPATAPPGGSSVAGSFRNDSDVVVVIVAVNRGRRRHRCRGCGPLLALFADVLHSLHRMVVRPFIL